MPAQYEAMRDKFISQGLSSKEAKGKAARIYNSKHHSNPVTNHMAYAKGGDVHSTSYAAGGPVLGRERSFLKEPDPFRTDKQKSDYSSKSGAKREGDKSLKAVKPRT